MNTHPTTSVHYRLPAGIALGGILVLGFVHLPVSFAPGIVTWGFDYWSEFSVGVRFALVALLALLAIHAVARTFTEAVQRASRNRIVGILAVLVLASLFVAFRTRGLAYGDGYSLSSLIHGTELPHLYDQLYFQPLDIILHWTVNQYAVKPLGLPFDMSYALLGALAGILSLWAIWRIARRLASDVSEVMLIVAAACTSSIVIFWFGHVESYTLANCALLWCLAFAIDVRDDHRAIWWAWGVCLFGIACHLLVVVAVPILIWVQWSRSRVAGAINRRGRAVLIFVAGFVICALGTFAFNALIHPVFVPILKTTNSAYTAFSVHHLTDIINLVLFVAPLTLLALPGILGGTSQREQSFDHAHTIVATFGAVTFYFAFWVDPLLGAFRDWDLLAAVGIPASIWAASVLLRRYDLRRMRSWLWVPVAGLALVHAGAFVATVQDDTAVAMRIDRLVREDVHYSGDFYKGARIAPWARILDRVFQRHDLEREHLAHWTEIDPSNGVAWASLANAYLRLRTDDSALACFEQAWSLDPDNAEFGYPVGLLRLKQGDSLAAMTALERVVVLSDTSYVARAVLGSLYLGFGQYARADSILDDAKRLNADFPDAYFYLSRIQERQGRLNDALMVLEDAFAHGADTPELRKYYQTIQRRIAERRGGSEQ